MVKKTIIVALMVFSFFCSCQTKPDVWDSSYPEERLADVRFVYMKLASYNGISVTKFNWVKIPAGAATFGGEVYIFHGGVQFTLRDMEFTCQFDAGTSYVVIGSQQDMLWGVSVHETSKPSRTTAENKIAFIPFKNQPKFN